MRTIVLYVPTLNSGGAEKVMVNLANELSKYNGLRIYLMTRYEGIYTNLVTDGVRIVDLRGMSFFNQFVYLKTLLPDVVLSTVNANIKAIILKYFMPSKTLFITRAPNIYYPWRHFKGYKERLASILLKYAYQHSDGIISNSPDTERSLQSVGITNVIKTIGNPVFRRSEILLDIDIPADVIPPYIVYVGSFKTQKRIDLLLETYLKVLNHFDVNLVIVGDGDDNNNKKKALSFVRNNNIEDKVLFVGRKSNLAGYYKYAKCFVLCSEFEGFGNVIVESLAYGTPVVCFDSPGGPNFIINNRKYGVVVKFGDTDLMSQRILDILNHKFVFDEKVLQSRADSFSCEVITKLYYDYIKELYSRKFDIAF